MYAGEICAARKGVAADFRDAGRDSNTGNRGVPESSIANRRYRGAVDFGGDVHNGVVSIIFFNCSSSGVKSKVPRGSCDRNGKCGTRFGVPIPVGQIKADNKVMRGFFSIRAGVDLYVITIVICILQFSAGNCAKSPYIVIFVVLYK